MNITEQILKKLKPQIDKMVQTSIEWIEKEQKRPLSKWGKEMVRLNIIYDMVRALEKYTEPTDKLDSISARGSAKGSMVINATIKRKGESHPLNTEVIFAGGYNIQKLHYRYLTKTTLPKGPTDSMTKALKAKINKMTKGERIRNTINQLETQYETTKKELESNKQKSDEDIVDTFRQDRDRRWLFKKWEDIPDEAPVKSHPKHKKTKQEFEDNQIESIANHVQRWRKQYITWKEDRLVSLKKTIDKEQKKLDSLVS